MIDLVKMGNVVSVARREKGYTQDELGSRLGVSAQAISKWERGMSLPDTDMLPDISRILEISIDYLLGITEYNSNATSFNESKKMNPHIRENPLDFLLTDELEIAVSINLFTDNKSSLMQNIDNIMKGIPNLRNEMARKRGLLIPIVRLIDSIELPDNTYQISVRSKIAARGSIYGDKFLYIPAGEKGESSAINGMPYTDPISGKEAIWIEQELKEAAEKEGGICRDISEIILSHFKEVVLSNAALLTHKQALKAIIENMKTRYPIIVEELIPQKISYDKLHKIIITLINKGHAIKDMLTICEVINNCLETTDDIQFIVSQIENSLSN